MIRFLRSIRDSRQLCLSTSPVLHPFASTYHSLLVFPFYLSLVFLSSLPQSLCLFLHLCLTSYYECLSLIWTLFSCILTFFYGHASQSWWLSHVCLWPTALPELWLISCGLPDISTQIFHRYCQLNAPSLNSPSYPSPCLPHPASFQSCSSSSFPSPGNGTCIHLDPWHFFLHHSIPNWLWKHSSVTLTSLHLLQQ